MATFIIILSFLSSSAHPKERESYAYGDHIDEINIGNTHTSDENIFTLGFDYEFFFSYYEHHFSFGLSLDNEFADIGNEFFLGPMASLYPGHHLKVFSAVGPLYIKGTAHFLYRVGLGYEFLFHPWLIIPNMSLDFVVGEMHVVSSLGLGYEF